MYLQTNYPIYDPEIIEKELRTIIKETPYNPLPYLYLGYLHFSLNDIYHALGWYNISIEKDQNLSAAYDSMGIIYSQKNETDKLLN